jgi:hypothetical protein
MPGAAAYDVYRAPAEGDYRWVRVLKGTPRPAQVVDPLPHFGATFRYVVSWRDAEGRRSPVSNEIRVTARTGSANKGAP